MNAQGFLVVANFASSPVLTVSAEAAAARERYFGFDGIPWPVDDPTGPRRPSGNTLAPVECWEETLAYFNFLRQRVSCHLLYVDASNDGSIPSEIQDTFSYAGIDYGFIEPEDAVFSVVLNEMICAQEGRLLSQFKSELNDNLLIGSQPQAYAIEKQRKALVEAGEKLKSCEVASEWRFFRVYRYEG